MSLVHLVYVSSAVSPFSEADLVKLLERSRNKNQAAGLSGMLLYRDGNFMQVLEGEAQAVDEVHARIGADPRHHGLMTLLKGPIEQRMFSEWSMGFRNLESAEVRNTPGYNEFMNADWRGDEMVVHPSQALKLLSVFRRSIR